MKNATLPLTQFFSTFARTAFAVWVGYYLLNIVTFWLTDKAFPATLKLDFIPGLRAYRHRYRLGCPSHHPHHRKQKEESRQNGFVKDLKKQLFPLLLPHFPPKKGTFPAESSFFVFFPSFFIFFSFYC